MINFKKTSAVLAATAASVLGSSSLAQAASYPPDNEPVRQLTVTPFHYSCHYDSNGDFSYGETDIYIQGYGFDAGSTVDLKVKPEGSNSYDLETTLTLVEMLESDGVDAETPYRWEYPGTWTATATHVDTGFSATGAAQCDARDPMSEQGGDPKSDTKTKPKTSSGSLPKTGPTDAWAALAAAGLLGTGGILVLMTKVRPRSVR